MLPGIARLRSQRRLVSANPFSCLACGANDAGMSDSYSEAFQTLTRHFESNGLRFLADAESSVPLARLCVITHAQARLDR